MYNDNFEYTIVSGKVARQSKGSQTMTGTTTRVLQIGLHEFLSLTNKATLRTYNRSREKRLPYGAAVLRHVKETSWWHVHRTRDILVLSSSENEKP